MGSPRGVPVPCTATKATSGPLMRAAVRASRMRVVWEGPLGAVRPLERPSWLTAEAWMLAKGGCMGSGEAGAKMTTAQHSRLVSRGPHVLAKACYRLEAATTA